MSDDFEARLRNEITAEEYVRRLEQRVRQRVRDGEIRVHYGRHLSRWRRWRERWRRS